MTNQKLDLELSANIEWIFSSYKAELVCTIEIWNTAQWTFKTRQWHFLSNSFFGLQVLNVLILTPIYLRKAVKDTF